MWLLALACTDPLPTGDGGLLGHGALWPYPSAQVMEEGRVRIPEGLLPMVTTPTPVERLDHRTGFSPLQTALVRLDRIDESALPTPSAPQRSGNVQMIDLETGRRVLSFAEVDDGGGSDGRLLMVRPLELMEYGHRIAVVVTTEVAPRPEVFQAVLDGADPIGCPEIGPRTRDLMDELDALGVPRSDVAVAWDFLAWDQNRPARSNGSSSKTTPQTASGSSPATSCRSATHRSPPLARSEPTSSVLPAPVVRTCSKPGSRSGAKPSPHRVSHHCFSVAST